MRSLWPQLRGRLAASLVPGVFIASFLLLLGPSTIYTTNPTEMTVSLGAILTALLPAAATLAAALALPALLLPGAMHLRYVATLLGLGLALWVQGNILLWRGGEIGATRAVLTSSPARAWGEVGLWIALPLLSFVFFRRLVRPLLVLGGDPACPELCLRDAVGRTRGRHFRHGTSGLRSCRRSASFSSRRVRT